MGQKNAGKLTVISGLPDKSVFHVKNHFTIGRDINNVFSICKNSVSRHHAHIAFIEKEEAFYIFDDGSENGVVVNGRMILGNEKLQNNDTIFLSDIEIKFEIVPYSDKLVFEEEAKDVPDESLGDDLTGTHFMDISEINPDYFEELREQKPKPKWIWDEGPKGDTKDAPPPDETK